MAGEDARAKFERLRELSDVTMPADLAQELGWSERRLKALAKRLGACRVIGKTMVLLPEDVRVILLEAKTDFRAGAKLQTSVSSQLATREKKDRAFDA